MSLGDLLAIMRRRWYFMVPFTLLSLLAGGYLYRTIPVSYESQSSVTLLDSTAIQELYVYVKARSDGWLKPGRPHRLSDLESKNKSP